MAVTPNTNINGQACDAGLIELKPVKVANIPNKK